MMSNKSALQGSERLSPATPCGRGVQMHAEPGWLGRGFAPSQVGAGEGARSWTGAGARDLKRGAVTFDYL